MELLITIVGTGVAVVAFIYGFLRNFKTDVNTRFDKIDARFDALNGKICKIEDRVIEVEKRLFAIETIMHLKDCCMLKEDRQSKRAE